MPAVSELKKGDKFRVPNWNEKVVLTHLDTDAKICVIREGKIMMAGLGVLAEGVNPDDLYLFPVTAEVDKVEV